MCQEFQDQNAKACWLCCHVIEGRNVQLEAKLDIDGLLKNIKAVARVVVLSELQMLIL